MALRSPPDLAELPDGTALSDIAPAHRVSVGTVRRWLAPELANSAPRRAVRRPRPRRGDADRIVALYAGGLTQAEVAAVVGCSTDTVAHYVREAGIVRHGHPRLDADDIARRYQTGQSLAEIAGALGASKSGVSRALDRAGVQRRPWGSHGEVDRSRRA